MISKVILRQLVIFGIIGVLATITHYSVAIGAHEKLGINLYQANLLGYIVAVAVSFVGHGKITFQTTLSHAVFLKFVVGSISVFLFSEMLLLVLEEYLQLLHRLSMLVIVLTVPILSFVLNKFWVYRVAVQPSSG